MRMLFVIALAFVISGCATTSGTNPIIGYSGFDNAKTVSIDPHGNACSSMVCTGLGAQWNSSNPDSAILIVQVFNEYAAISQAELIIDGNKVTLSSAQTVTDFSYPGSAIRESSKGFGIPFSVIEQILSAKRVWLRVHTPTGYIEDPVIDGEKDSKAYHALSRFVTAVKS
ncbi:hypothetical protein [Shewanella sp. KJ2020]|uniref:hypothetical protein n=1 Tax=Shewanella sp. KJ2020 TaxID=2919172 RepID=UPI0020A7E2F7|nr:hypothetical protein [Shewanella sp. KJ2020]MCP3129259.1 hypothetical protein [Shewanella sp. KJ2020]